MNKANRSVPHVVVVGGGISGLASAYRIRQRLPEAQITVIERESGFGGTATTQLQDDLVLERGPNGFLTNVTSTLDLARELGLEDELVRADDSANKRFIYRHGRLVALPAGPKFLTDDDFLSFKGRMRVLREPFVKARRDGVDESFYEFIARRFGPELADVVAQAFITGITAGSARAISIGALYPKFVEMEQEYGSVIKAGVGMARKAKKARAAGEQVARPTLTSFRGAGMQRLTDRLAEVLDADLVTSAGVTSLARHGAHYQVISEDRSWDADHVVLATPAPVSASLVSGMSSAASEALKGIPYAGTRVFSLAYRKASLPKPVSGFGFLVPRGQGLRILGCLYTSCIFPTHAPDDIVLLRVIAGGVFDPAILGESAADALAIVRHDLQTALGIATPPELVAETNWLRAIPQYNIGHRERVADVERLLRRDTPGISVTGNAYYGVSYNDCVSDADRVGQEVADRVKLMELA